MGAYPFATGRSEGTPSERMMLSLYLEPVYIINSVFSFEAPGREKGLGVLTMPVDPQWWGALCELGRWSSSTPQQTEAWPEC